MVHGGEKFAGSTILTEEVMATVEECNDLAPLHNPANIIGVIGDEREGYSMWSECPDYLGTLTYTYDNGFSETFSVNNTLLDLIQEHMK